MLNDTVFNSQAASPSRSGSITFKMQIKPASTQTSRSRKQEVTNAIRSCTRALEYVLSGDVAIEIIWHVCEQVRYESDESADVDNIKPILDSLCGPDGIIINDCQVQYISSNWADTCGDEQVAITIKFDPEAWFPKSSLAFVQFQKALCMPLNLSLPPESLLEILNAFEYQLATREKLIKLGQIHQDASEVMSIQRPFHRTRVIGFPTFPLHEMRERLTEDRNA